MPSTPPRIAIICLWLELAEEIASQISSQFQVNGEHALSHWNALIWKEYRSLVVSSRHLWNAASPMLLPPSGINNPNVFLSEQHY